MEEKKKRSGNAKILLIIVILILLGSTILSSTGDKQITATVTRKDTVTSYNKKSGNRTKYYIYCTDGNGREYKFKNGNMLIRGKMNSSKIYSQIEEGKTYTFTVTGHEIPVIAPYLNILKFEEVN